MTSANDKALNFLFQIIIAIQLIAVAILYANVQFPDPPPQKISSLTGLPVWMSASSGFTAINETVGLIEYIAAFLTGALAMYCIYIKLHNRQPVSSPVETSPVDGQGSAENIVWTKMLFDTIVTGYIIVTFIALITSVIFEVGKLWSAFGIYHNVLELCLAAALLQNGTFNYIMGLITTVVYSISAVAITSQLDWYWDATFFKFQGEFYIHF
ncbi:15767_t:CDS:1 [Gigaspora rosea]|nr:15767_t:CDS:1 [Gigaspora rosea]